MADEQKQNDDERKLFIGGLPQDITEVRSKRPPVKKSSWWEKMDSSEKTWPTFHVVSVISHVFSPTWTQNVFHLIVRDPRALRRLRLRRFGHHQDGSGHRPLKVRLQIRCLLFGNSSAE